MGWDVASQQQSVRFILLKLLHFIFEGLLELLIHYCESNQLIKYKGIHVTYGMSHTLERLKTTQVNVISG